MIDAPANHTRRITAKLTDHLNAGHAKPKFAVGGSAALDFHGVPVTRPVGDVDLVAVEAVKSPAALHRALLEAGCKELGSSRDFSRKIRNGRVPFVYDGLEFDLLHQHACTAKAIPLQAEAAAQVMSFTHQNISHVDGIAVLDIDAIVLWQALFNRPKDRAHITALINLRTPDGQPAIRNRGRILELVIAARSEYGPEAKFLKEALWKPWFPTYP